MRTRLAERWLALLGAPDALLGDLREAAATRPALWYWQQVALVTLVFVARTLRRHPVRCAQVAAMALLAVFATHRLLASRTSVTPSQALDISVESSGWLALPEPDGRVRVIPTVSVRVTNQTPMRLTGVQLNVVFRRATDNAEWDSVWKPRIGGGGLAPEPHSERLVIASNYGHVGSEPPARLLEHSEFVDARVELYAKYGAQPWTRLAGHDVGRALTQ